MRGGPCRVTAMTRLLRSATLWFGMVLALIAGAVLLGAAAWLQPVLDAQAARDRGDAGIALEQYRIGEDRLARVPMGGQLLRSVQEAVQANQYRLLYERKEHDELIEKAEASAPTAESHFWTGCAFFQKALAENKNPDTRLGWFRRSEEEFRQALELNPEDWDSKFNYELTRRLLMQMRKEPRLAPPELRKFLRPEPDKQQQPTRRTG